MERCRIEAGRARVTSHLTKPSKVVRVGASIIICDELDVIKSF